MELHASQGMTGSLGILYLAYSRVNYMYAALWCIVPINFAEGLTPSFRFQSIDDLLRISQSSNSRARVPRIEEQFGLDD